MCYEYNLLSIHLNITSWSIQYLPAVGFKGGSETFVAFSIMEDGSDRHNLQHLQWIPTATLIAKKHQHFYRNVFKNPLVVI